MLPHHIRQDIPKSSHHKKKIVFFFLLLFFLGALGIGFSSWVWPRLKKSSFFSFKESVVLATEHISEEELRALVHIPLGKNIFDIDLVTLEAVIKKHPWIETVKVFRMLPNKVKFIVEEKKPVALLSQDSLYFLDAEGKKIAPIRAGENTDFLIVSGLETAHVESGALVLQAYELAEEYQKNEFLKDLPLSEIHWDETLGFFLFTKHPSFEIRVGKEEYPKKFLRLEKVLKDLAHKSLAPRLVDLNYSKKVVVKLSK